MLAIVGLRVHQLTQYFQVLTTLRRQTIFTYFQGAPVVTQRPEKVKDSIFMSLSLTVFFDCQPGDGQDFC